MSTLLIEGGQRLSGSVDVEGNKNAALPLLAACLLTAEECVLTNVPRISDVEVMARLILDLGGEVEGIGSTTLRVRCPEHRQGRARPGAGRPPARLGAAAGPLLARRGRAQLAPPGGDFPARRTLNTHLEALEAMGARRVEGSRSRARRAGRLASDVDLSVRGVGHRNRDRVARRRRRAGHDRDSPRRVRAARRRAVRIPGAARRRHHRARARRRFASKEARGLRGAEHRLWGDYIEAGSWAVVAAVTGGEIEVHGARAEDMEVVAAVLTRLDDRLRDGRRRLPRRAVAAARRRPHHHQPVARVSERPGQPRHRPRDAGGRADARARLDVRAALFALEQLSGMSADLFLCDPHRIIVTGPRKLRGRPLDSRDLRSGMALIAAALAADGQSRLSPLETVERGYGRLVERLQGLGREGSEAAVERSGCVGGLRSGSPSVTDAPPPGFLTGGGSSLGGSGGLGGSTGSGSSASGASESRPTRNGRRSASVRSSTRMMCGVSVRMMSV